MSDYINGVDVGDAPQGAGNPYALFSGVALLSTVSLLLAPVIHRILHRMHVEGR